jgi:hypothetical protein
VTPDAAGAVRPTLAYYFPLVYFTGGTVANLYFLVRQSYICVLGVVAGVALLWTYLRYARTVDLTATTLSWRGPLGGAEVPISFVLGVRSSRLKQAVVIDCGNTQLRLLQGPAAKDLVEALQQLRPDLVVEGRIGRQWWMNAPIQIFSRR